MIKSKLGAATMWSAAIALLHVSIARADAPAPDHKAVAASASDRMISTEREWTGVWVLKGESLDGRPYSARSNVKKPGQPELPPHQGEIAAKALEKLLTPAYAAKYQAAKQDQVKGKPVDPTAACLPQGMPNIMYGPFAMEIVLAPTQMNFFSEWNEQTRHIYIGEEKHPADLMPTYNGHSIAHWDGDTLVVDTIGIRPETWLQEEGMHHSDKLHIVERFHLVPPDLLQDDMTMEDPEALTQPWHGPILFRKKPDLQTMEYVCEENNRER